MPLRTMLATTLAVMPALTLTPPARSARVAAKPLLLAEFFSGNSTARGVFRSWIAGVERGFQVKALGRRSGDEIIFVEEFLFDDGEKDTKTWRFRKIGPNRYHGTRENLVGFADIVEENGRIHMTYVMDLGTHGKTQRLRFRDILYHDTEGRVENVAKVSKFGIPVARIDVLFEK